MGRDLYDAYPEARDVFDLAGRVLVDLDLKALCFQGPEDALKQTAVTQPAIFTHSVAALQVLKGRGIGPHLVAGHSVGEIAALVAAEVVSVEEGLRIVRARGQAMQAAGEAQPGTMAAIIGAEDPDVIALCDAASEAGIITPANFNCPGQVVISGEGKAIQKALELASERGIKRAVKLPVSGAFHSELMQPAVEALTDVLDAISFAPASVPVIPNVSAEPTTDPERLKALLLRQIVSPVRWTESMQHLTTQNIPAACEVGPGTVLKGLMRRIDRNITVHEVGTRDAMENLTP